MNAHFERQVLVRSFVLCLAICLVGAATAACGGDSAGNGGSGGSTPAQTVRISLTDSGCQPTHVDLHAGAVTFVVSNPRSSRVQSFAILAQGQSNPLAQVTNVLGGLTRELDADLQPGAYTLRCRQNNLGGDATLTVTK